MRPPAVIAFLVLALLVGAPPALATPAQDAFGVTQAQLDAPSLDGDGLVVAVIDSGVDDSQPALAGRVLHFEDFVGDETDPYDDLGHGTWVAGIIAGQQTALLGAGVAPQAKIVGVKVSDGMGGSSLQTIADGIDWVVAHRVQYGIDVINLSVGDPAGGDGSDDVAEQAVQRAVDAGVVVVAAAGNVPGLSHIATPASAEEAITVAGMADPTAPASVGGPGFRPILFSSAGPAAGGDAKPDLIAAAVHRAAWAGVPEGIEGAGTSGAAAFTSGVVALMLDANPSLTPADVKQALMATSEDWGRPGADEDYGAGRLDVYAALNAAGAPLATPPAVPDHLMLSGTVDAGSPSEQHVTVSGAPRSLAVTLIPAGTANLDLRLEGPGGVVATAATTARRETLALTAAAPGDYTLRVTAAAGTSDYRLDVSGEVGGADATAPALTVDTPAQGTLTRDTTPSLAGNAGSEPGDFPGVVARVFRGATEVGRLRAQMAGGRWTAEPAALPDGTYEVRAEQGDRRHNVSHQAVTFTIDSTPPDTTLNRSGTTFTFGADEPVLRFDCSLDGAAFVVCATPLGLGALAAGDHTLAARAVDVAGNVDPTPATVTWNVPAPPPADPPASSPPPPDSDDPGLAFASSLPRRIAALRGRGLAIGLGCDEACGIHAELRIAAKLARKLGLPKKLASADADLAGAGSATLKLRPSAAVRKRLRRVRSLKAELVIVATDAAGNASRLNQALKLR